MGWVWGSKETPKGSQWPGVCSSVFSQELDQKAEEETERPRVRVRWVHVPTEMKMEAPQTWVMTEDAKASSKWLSTNVHMV